MKVLSAKDFERDIEIHSQQLRLAIAERHAAYYREHASTRPVGMAKALIDHINCMTARLPSA